MPNSQNSLDVIILPMVAILKDDEGHVIFLGGQLLDEIRFHHPRLNVTSGILYFLLLFQRVQLVVGTLIFRQFSLSFEHVVRESGAIFQVTFSDAVIASRGIVKDLRCQQS